MANQPEPTVRELLEEVDKWAYRLSIGAVVIITIAYFIVSGWKAPEGFISSIRAYALAIIPNLVPVFVIFAFSYVFLRRIQSIKSREESKELVEKIAAQTRGDLKSLMQQFEQAKEQIIPYPSRTAIYSVARANLNSGSWRKVCVFAPVGLWKKDNDKKDWLIELAEHATTRSVEEVWGVFGLPPKTEIEDGKVKLRDTVKVDEDLKYVFEVLSYFNGLTNVRLHFYPPTHASVGFGALIFERKDGTGQVAFGLASHTDAEVVDTGLGLDDRAINREVYSYALSWFDSRIFWSATSAFILQDDKKSFKERWNRIIEDWYPEYPELKAKAG